MAATSCWPRTRHASLASWKRSSIRSAGGVAFRRDVCGADAAVDAQFVTADVGGGIAREERGCFGDLGRPREAPVGDVDEAAGLGVAAAARNARLAQAVEDARSALFEVHDAQEHSVLQETSGDGHDAVIKAIVARDAEQARRAMEEHIRTAWQEILAAIGGEPPS
jgi:FCD domain